MWRGTRIRAFGALAVTLVVASPALAQVVERVRVPDRLPAGVSLLLTSPPEYGRESVAGVRGRWLGPEYGGGNTRGRSVIQWSVGFVERAANSEAAARGGLTKGWQQALRGGISIPHVVGRRLVGTIDGDFVLTGGPLPEADAAHEATMAFAVAPGVHAVINFLLPEPAADVSGPGDVHVGRIRASTWNRGQAFRALAGVRLAGNLPPTRVTARAAPGRGIRGEVGDAFRHPVLGARVIAERRTGARWVVAGSSKTDVRGAYSLTVPRPGLYRTTARVATARASSPAIRVG